MKKPLVIKIGGAILEKKSALNALLMEIVKLNVGVAKPQPVVLVHGGGSTVDVMLAQAGFVTEKRNGLRVTPAEQMPIIGGALAGYVNKTIVAQANHCGLAAVGLSLSDGNMAACALSPDNLGAVGLPSPQSSKLLDTLLTAGFMPIISSIGVLNSPKSEAEDAQLLNVNADDAAVAVCQLLNANLLLLTDVSGVRGADGKDMASLNSAQAHELMQQGVIAGGMTAKVNAALLAANKLQRSIVVASWQTPEKIKELIAGENIGTRIQPDE